MHRKSWHVHVATEVSLPHSALGSHVLSPGEYVMREIDISSYDIASAVLKVRLGFSHIFRMQRSGAIQIDGVFP
ncbi:MAG: hypothetical protein WDO68_07675 [Gammaproteobacteria bacterium]